jgi:hypothetical protein
MAAVQDAGDRAGPRPGRQVPLVAYVQAIGLEAGDRQRLVVRNPAGEIVTANEIPPLDRAKAQYLLFAGRRAPAGGWPSGRYTADYSVLRANRPVITQRFEVAL